MCNMMSLQICFFIHVVLVESSKKRFKIRHPIYGWYGELRCPIQWHKWGFWGGNSLAGRCWCYWNQTHPFIPLWGACVSKRETCTLVIVSDKLCLAWRKRDVVLKGGIGPRPSPITSCSTPPWPMNVRARWTKTEWLSKGGRIGGRGEGDDGVGTDGWVGYPTSTDTALKALYTKRLHLLTPALSQDWALHRWRSVQRHARVQEAWKDDLPSRSLGEDGPLYLSPPWPSYVLSAEGRDVKRKQI